MKSRDKSGHQKRIEDFMRKAGQDVLTQPCLPTADVRLLRAKLIFEEAMETIFALGVDVMIRPVRNQHDPAVLSEGMYSLEVNKSRPPDLIEIADGVCDLSVVSIGTLSACGIADKPLLKEVDESNLRKFGPGSKMREDGKWLKPSGWKKPDIEGVLNGQHPDSLKGVEPQKSDMVW